MHVSSTIVPVSTKTADSIFALVCQHICLCMSQISLESIWAVVGSLDPPLAESDTTDSLDSPQPDDMGRHAMSRTSSEGHERSVSLSGLDIHSCLQFLLELYGAWLHVDNNPKPPLMLVNAVVKSVSGLMPVMVLSLILMGEGKIDLMGLFLFFNPLAFITPWRRTQAKCIDRSVGLFCGH